MDEGEAGASAGVPEGEVLLERGAGCSWRVESAGDAGALNGSSRGCWAGSFASVGSELGSESGDITISGVGWGDSMLCDSLDGVGVVASAISFSDFSRTGGSRERPSEVNETQ